MKMNLVMKDQMTTTTMTTVGDGYLNLMKRSLNGSGGFSPLPEGSGRTMGTDTLVGRMSGDERRV